MGDKKARLFILLIGTTLAILLLSLISLPGFARSTALSLTSLSPTATPSIDFRSLSAGSYVGSAAPTPIPSINSTTYKASYSVVSGSINLVYLDLSNTTDIATPTLTPAQVDFPQVYTTSQPTAVFYFPILSRDHFVPTPTSSPTPPPPETVLFCDSLTEPKSIPDDDPNGVHDRISIADGRLVSSLNLYLDISHTWVGDLVVNLSNEDTGETITAVNRPGVPASDLGCGTDNIITILDDGAIQPAEDQCASLAPAISGIYQPEGQLSTFSGKGISGTWRINVSDNYPNDTGRLNHWCLQAALSDTLPSPTPPPTPVTLPDSAYVPGMFGQDQQFTLDCESRSAVDWARHFGFNIDELHFLDRLPRSDDPELGFVGDPEGAWGNIPPDDYGVHALPVADLLSNYGLTATAYSSLSWDDLRAEIAIGNPVIVWIIGGVSRNLVNGIPYYYTPPSTGYTTIVAPGEHTVIVIGYSPDTVTVLNGSHIVDVPLDQFLDSWSVLNFKAVLARQ